jgi:choline-sulfatase
MAEKQPRSTRRTQSRIFSAISAVAAVGLIAVAAAGWWLSHRQQPIASGSCSNCNILLITIDTLRTDRVGAFGGSPQLTPNLDRLAADSVRFTRAYASAPLTLPSHTSILTSLSPPAHGIRANGLFRLADSVPTLATVLRERGYRTGAFVGAFVLDARFGLSRGFDVYDDNYGEKHEGDETEGAERRAEDVIKPATSWILGEKDAAIKDSPSARGPREQSESSSGAARASGGGAPRAVKEDGAAGASSPSSPPGVSRPWFAWVHLYDPHAPYRAPEPYASQHEPYDAEVAYTDAMVGKLLDDLRHANQLDRTIVVVTADHGESLGEHGERTHGVFAYDVTMRVPWFMWTGGHSAGRAFDGLARLIDLAPTALDVVGIPPPASFEGRSLLNAVNGQNAPPATAYIEAMDANLTRNWAPLTGIVAGNTKLVDLPAPEVYELDRDPHEATNVFAKESERARALGVLLRDARSALESHASSAQKTTLNAEARQRLQALGYVASSAESGSRVYTASDDPKALIGPSNDLDDAVKAFNAGSRADAMATVRAIARDHPRFSTAFGQLAAMQRQTGDLAGAIATLEDIVKRGIADHRVMIVLAGYLTESGQKEKAAALLDAVIAAHPDSFDAYNSLGVVMMRAGRHDRARAAFAKAVELDPTSAVALANWGSDDLAAGQLAPAIEHLRRAVALDTRQFDALYNLGLALYESGRKDEAQPYLRQFVSTAPPARYAADIEHLRSLIKK